MVRCGGRSRNASRDRFEFVFRWRPFDERWAHNGLKKKASKFNSAFEAGSISALDHVHIGPLQHLAVPGSVAVPVHASATRPTPPHSLGSTHLKWQKDPLIWRLRQRSAGTLTAALDLCMTMCSQQIYVMCSQQIYVAPPNLVVGITTNVPLLNDGVFCASFHLQHKQQVATCLLS